jgi:hypothetical protein
MGPFLAKPSIHMIFSRSLVWISQNPIKTPTGTNGHLNLDMGGKLVDQKVYHSIIGSLHYLCVSRPDIMLSVCMCARFQAAPK